MYKLGDRKRLPLIDIQARSVDWKDRRCRKRLKEAEVTLLSSGAARGRLGLNLREIGSMVQVRGIIVAVVRDPVMPVILIITLAMPILFTALAISISAIA